MLDTLIQGGTVIDGTGAEPYMADVGIRDGQITAVGRIDEPAKRTIDATGLHVLPGFVDIHTHYDGQASWDETFAPSIYHGVTTVVMGNCGVGFAPVRPGDRDVLIDLMEGVEEIPGTALSEGMKWNWESFTDYGRVLDAQPHSLDFMTLVPHDTLRLYVMGDRAARGEPATADDIVQMQVLLRQALLDGACGLAVGSTETHRTAQGRMTPSFEVSPVELNGLAAVLKDLPYRVLQGISDFASPRGAPEEEKARFNREYAKLETMAKVAGRPISITWMDRVIAPRQSQWLGDASLASAAQGIDVKLQASPRGIGVFNGLDTTLNLLAAFPSYQAIAHLPARERAAQLRDPATRIAHPLGSARQPVGGRLVGATPGRFRDPALREDRLHAVPAAARRRWQHGLRAPARAVVRGPGQGTWCVGPRTDVRPPRSKAMAPTWSISRSTTTLNGSLDRVREMMMHPPGALLAG